MSPIVLVAIPSEDDYIWKISSQKTPHMTLLSFGDQGSDFPSGRALQYLEHAINTSVVRFGADVIRRGELGPDPADVIFFSKTSTHQLDEFRSFILQNDEFSKAYSSAPQFPTWIPHLTLGTPNAPAKPDKRDFPGTSWVNFDRIALWTGESEGPEFSLKSEGEEEASMSDRIDEILSHFGVKGMHWGVRRLREGNKHASDDAKNAKTARKTVRRHGVKALTNEQLKKLNERMRLEQEFKNLKGKTPSGAGGKMASEILRDVGRQEATRIVATVAAKQIAKVLVK